MKNDSVDPGTRPHDVINPSRIASSNHSQTTTWNTFNPATENFSDIERIQSPFDRDLILRELVVATDEEHMFNLLDESISRLNMAGIRKLLLSSQIPSFRYGCTRFEQES